MHNYGTVLVIAVWRPDFMRHAPGSAVVVRGGLAARAFAAPQPAYRPQSCSVRESVESSPATQPSARP